MEASCPQTAPAQFGGKCPDPKGYRCRGTVRTVEQVTGHQSVKHPGWPMCDSCKALFRPDGWYAGSMWEYADTVPPWALEASRMAMGAARAEQPAPAVPDSADPEIPW